MDIIRQNAGRLLIFGSFVFLLVFAHHAWGAGEKEFAAFCQAKSGEAFAALLGLITGGALAGMNGKSTPPPDVAVTSQPPQPNGDTHA